MKEFILHTDGKGLWSNKSRSVRCNKMLINVMVMDDDGRLFGELRLYFNIKDWSTSYDGLIYTDKEFLNNLKKHLKSEGFDDKCLKGHLSYSEQGMQSNDYVSFDVDHDFIVRFKELNIGEVLE